MAGGPLTATDLIAAASMSLEAGGYSRVSDDKLGGRATADARLYEDPYSVVSLIVYEAWSELASSWTEAQAELVELMSAYMTSADPKSWEGYLVLLTPGSASGDEVQSLSSIRYDISRVRKLVATGDELKQISDVHRTLLPLLPLEAAPTGDGDGSVLDLLPSLLASQGIDAGAVKSIIDAFAAQQPLVESLHEYRSGA